MAGIGTIFWDRLRIPAIYIHARGEIESNIAPAAPNLQLHLRLGRMALRESSSRVQKGPLRDNLDALRGLSKQLHKTAMKEELRPAQCEHVAYVLNRPDKTSDGIMDTYLDDVL